MYTAEDLSAIERAIQKLQSGERVVSVAYGNHVVRYAEVDLKDLLALRQRVRSELNVAGLSPKRRLTFATHKGIN